MKYFLWHLFCILVIAATVLLHNYGKSDSFQQKYTFPRKSLLPKQVPNRYTFFWRPLGLYWSLIQIREQKYFSALRKTEQIHNSLLTLLQTAQTCSNLSSSTCCCSAWNFPPDSCMARSITSFKSLVKIHFLVRPLFKISIPLCMHNELHIPFFSFVVFSLAMISNIANLHI